MPPSRSALANIVHTVQATMNRVKDALGLPRSIGLLGSIRACPILVFLVALAVVAIGVMVFG